MPLLFQRGGGGGHNYNKLISFLKFNVKTKSCNSKSSLLLSLPTIQCLHQYIGRQFAFLFCPKLLLLLYIVTHTLHTCYTHNTHVTHNSMLTKVHWEAVCLSLPPQAPPPLVYHYTHVTHVIHITHMLHTLPIIQCLPQYIGRQFAFLFCPKLLLLWYIIIHMLHTLYTLHTCYTLYP